MLALCLTGFPGFESAGDTRRSLIYLGPGALRSPDDSRPSLFTDAQVTEIAQRAGVQINAIATPGRETEALDRDHRRDRRAVLPLRHRGPRRRPRRDPRRPAAREDGLGADRGDSPVLVLVAALALASLLGVSLMAVRR